MNVICGGMNGNIVVGGLCVCEFNNWVLREKENVMDFYDAVFPAVKRYSYRNTHTRTHMHVLTVCIHLQFNTK